MMHCVVRHVCRVFIMPWKELACIHMIGGSDPRPTSLKRMIIITTSMIKEPTGHFARLEFEVDSKEA